ncbi:MAG: hypothetical protein HGA90_02385 [Alphaproteobacteria bacterium]|nr:hypothetical protein [Alphaproteobacteria bacterium]
MQRLKAALERLDEMISTLEDKIGLDSATHYETQKKHAEILKASRAREANLLAVTQKVATRLDQTIEHVENVLRS